MSVIQGEIDKGVALGIERSLASWEIVSVISATLLAMWLVPALFVERRAFMIAMIVPAFVFMIVSMFVHGETMRVLGLRLDNFWRAWKVMLIPTLLATGVLIIAGWFGGSLNFRRWQGGRDVLEIPTLGIEWGFVQQFALQCFINRRAQILFGKGGKSVVLTAAVFALLHFPNPALTLVTFAAGLFWSHVYQREPNLFALAASHGLMTWVLISSVPEGLLNNLRVGYKFFGLFI